MQNWLHYLIPVLIICFIVYRRAKRTIGFQKLATRRLTVRLALFSLLGGIIFLLGFIHPIHYIGYGLGLAGGTYLGLTANRYTRFEHRNYGWYYRTHLWVEVAVLVLFLGRIAYRYAVIAVTTTSTTTQFNPAELAQFTKDPVTAGVFFIIVSYYVLYFSYLLRESSKLTQAAPAADEVASIGHVEGPCSL